MNKREGAMLDINSFRNGSDDGGTVPAGKKGPVITFGHYPQKQGSLPMPIEWQILERKTNQLLMISKFALDCKPYNEAYRDTTWETCSIWLESRARIIS